MRRAFPHHPARRERGARRRRRRPADGGASVRPRAGRRARPHSRGDPGRSRRARPADVRAADAASCPGAAAELDPLVGLNDDGKALRSKLLAVPALRAQYLAYVRDIAEKWLDWKTLGPAAQKYHDLIAADVQADTRKLFDNAGFTEGVGSVREFADARRAYL